MRNLSDATPLPLADRFRLARRTAIELNGHRVRSMFALPIPGSSTLRIRRLRASTARPQGLRLSSQFDLVANGRRARELVLWSTTAPSSVDVVVEAPGDTFVHLWNTWLDDGIEHAWLADAGMLVTTDLTGVNPSLQLSCSDGFAPASFDDLALSVEIIVPAPITLAPRKASVASG